MRFPEAWRAAWNNEQVPAATRWLYLASVICSLTAVVMLFWPAAPSTQVWFVGMLLAFAGLGYHVGRTWR